MRRVASLRSSMGCAASNPKPRACDSETARKGVPARIELPLGQGSWRACTVGRGLTLENAFEIRVDNGGPILTTKLFRPASLNNYAEFNEMVDADGDEDEQYEAYTKSLPLLPAQPINVWVASESRLVEGRVCEARQYVGGERLLVLLSPPEDVLVDASVVEPVINAGSLHKLSVPGKGKDAKSREVEVDLNDFNHCQQLFPSVDEFRAARVDYLKALIQRLGQVDDAITGNRLNIDDQVRHLPRLACRPFFLSESQMAHIAPRHRSSSLRLLHI